MEPHPNAAIDFLEWDGIGAGDAPAPRRMRTDGLVLHRAHPDRIEVDRLHALFRDAAEGVFGPCGWDRHETEAETGSYLERRRTEWDGGNRYEYVLESGGEYLGTTCIAASDGGSVEFGLWLDRPHWNRGFSRGVTDALVHAAFEALEAPFVVLGCLPENDRSRRAIESAVRRYRGAYYGALPTVPSRDDGLGVHHEWVVTRDGYDSGERGLSTLVPGVDYDDLEFRA